MVIFFGLVVTFGLLWAILEFAAKANSPAPSMYRTTGAGGLMITVGLIGAVCAYLFR